ncbi:MAG TPA: septum formation initiator family protein [Clostridiaceae bacterium]|nr:septum formation initiator family protein [Clostridiaceae bacterium]
MKAGKKTRLIFIALALFIVYFTVTFIEQQNMINAKSKQIETINQKIAEEQKINEELNKNIEIIGSDEYIEKVARERLGMVKSGEKLFIDTNK